MWLYETLTGQELGGFGPEDVLFILVLGFCVGFVGMLFWKGGSRTQRWFGSLTSAPTCLVVQGSEPAPSQGTVPPLDQSQK